MTIEERQALEENIIDSMQSFDAWRQEDVERGGVRVHLQCTKLELDFLLGLLENKGEWIPISKKLPDETGWYLVTFSTGDGGKGVCELSYRKPENYWTDRNIAKKAFDNDELLAWMPKPRPYEESEEI